ncbi:MAG: hypothetical protein KF700_08565 [Hyphomonadaceae bacterium]|nr:hypothetical protein [Hyphomonadaceae bacterium]
MVSSIVPGTAGANALGVDQRFARAPSQAPLRREDAAAGDRVDVSGAAAWASARESVRAGLEQVQTALALGHEAQSMLLKVQAIARGEGGGQSELDAVLNAFAQRVDAAGVGLVSGQTLAVQAEPGATPVEIAGADLRLKGEPGSVLALTLDANAADAPALNAAVQRSLESLQTAMEGLFKAARALEAHQGFLGAVQGVAANADLDADGARLLALQVRQGLEAMGGASIANVEPQAVLSLFRA